MAVEKVKAKFDGVLKYFGEDPSMTSQYFFSTLQKFIQEFIGARDYVDRARRAETRAALRDSKSFTRSSRTNSSAALVSSTSSSFL